MAWQINGPEDPFTNSFHQSKKSFSNLTEPNTQRSYSMIRSLNAENHIFIYTKMKKKNIKQIIKINYIS